MHSLQRAFPRFLVFLFLIFGSTGCNFPVESFSDLRTWFNHLLFSFKSSPSPQSLDETSGVRDEESEEGSRKEKAQLVRQVELLSEIYRVVLLQKEEDPEEFMAWLSTLQQGASLEGIYNAFTHSSKYRNQELQNPGARARALNVFGLELANIQKEMKNPTPLNRRAAQALAFPVPPGHAVDAAESEMRRRDAPIPISENLEEYSQQIASLFIGASIFTLKRVLGDEALLLMEEKQKNSAEFARWYSQWVMQMVQNYSTDYGLSLRRKSNRNFHTLWALEASPDQIKWEVLNRLHRVLNEANDLR
jgi:prophage antirepressor-like protein